MPGSCVLVTQEGTRPLLVEVQALVDTAHVPNPRRLSVGLDRQRLAMLLAVLHRHAGIAAYDQDVSNAVGGVRSAEPAADLAVLLAIVSSMRDRPLPRGLVAFGEVGLAGEIRPRRAARSACARPPSWASRRRSFHARMRQSTASKDSRSSLSIGLCRRSSSWRVN